MSGLALLFLLNSTTSLLAQPWISVKDNGATGKKADLQTTAIQKAIDAVAANGGGTVYFPPGDYTSSTFFIKSNVRIYLEAGATLYASRKPEDYKFTKGIYSTETDVPILIYAENQQNITFDGRGTVDGQAEQVYENLRETDNFIKDETENAKAAGVEMKRFYAVDPKVCLFYLVSCKNVLIEGISVLRSPNWTIHCANSELVNLKGLYVFSSLEKGVNADGIDIDGCKDVRISDCTVITGDDAICLKSTNKNGKYTACENVTITNCTLISTSTALKIGTESHGDFNNIIFTNSTVSNTNRGIGIFVRDGANVSNVIFSNLTIQCKRKHFNWWGDGDPIRFVLLKRKPESRLGSIKNVLVQNVIATGEGSSLIEGYPGKNLENLTLSNVSLEMKPESLPDKRAVSGIKIAGVENIKLDNVSVSFDNANPEKKWQNAFYGANLKKLSITNSTFNHAGSNTTSVWLDNVDGAILRNIQTDLPAKTFLKNTGSKALRVSGTNGE